MSRSVWLENLLKIAVILMVPLIACAGYYAMAGGADIAAGVSRIGGMALGIVSLMGMVSAMRPSRYTGQLVIFWGVVLLLALLLCLLGWR
ncbi:hypothetical protein [Porticoccus sp.]|nr:MAG: hypothetical protein EP324_02345 [Gammaproteobacteria bacterium]